MLKGYKLHVWGDYACFTRPEMKAERVSYDVITPSAARGILEAIHWKPAIRWVIDRIHVLNPIRFDTIRRNEVEVKIAQKTVKTAMKKKDLSGLGIAVEEKRQQRATVALCDVAYVIEAHFEMTNKTGKDDNEAKHADMFRRRAQCGQCFHRPYLGVREFPADFELVSEDFPSSQPKGSDRDLGWMLYDIDYADNHTPHFFRARLCKGVIDLRNDRPEVFGQ